MEITTSPRSHIPVALRGLLELGWKPKIAPENGVLTPNRQLIRLEWPGHQLAVRLLAFKIGESGRERRHERRLEITSTYSSGLPRIAPPFQDVVLGYDPSSDVFVGVDPRRLGEGGETANASTFIDREQIAKAQTLGMLIAPRKVNLFVTEHLAYFRPWKLTEYLTNAMSIHLGSYDGRGAFSGSSRTARPMKPQVPDNAAFGDEFVLTHRASDTAKPKWNERDIWNALEREDIASIRSRKVSPQELLQLMRRMVDVGTMGEEHVMTRERQRLRKAGRNDLADGIKWVSQSQPYLGYDIRSFEADGSKRFIEVKSTTGDRRSFPMSANEWEVARVKGPRYFIYRVTNVMNKKPNVLELNDPEALRAKGDLTIAPFTWLVSY